MAAGMAKMTTQISLKLILANYSFTITDRHFFDRNIFVEAEMAHLIVKQIYPIGPTWRQDGVRMNKFGIFSVTASLPL